VGSDVGCDTEVAGLERGLVCPVDADVESDEGCDAGVAELDTGLACPVDVDKETDEGCDAEVTELGTGLVCPVDADELKTGLDSCADVAVPDVSAVPLGMIVTLEEEEENV
jgi:hypothetical protein